MSFNGVLRNSDTDDRALKPLTKDRKYVYSDFRGLVMASTCDTPYGAPTGTGGDVNNLKIDGVDFQTHVIGTQTILAPSRTSAGLNIAQDVTSGDGIEYTLGMESPANTVIGALSHGTFTIGTDAPFALSVKFTIPTVLGVTGLVIGFRKVEAYQADFNDYNDLAALNMKAGTIYTETILANAATTETSTTQTYADGVVGRFTVLVDSDGTLFNKSASGQTPSAIGGVGKVYYEIDGVKPTALPATTFAFASGSVVAPFIWFKQSATTTATLTLNEFECGIHPIRNTNQIAAQGTTTNSGA